MTEIAIILPVRNRKPLTQAILTQIYGQIDLLTLEGIEIAVVVVDDGSTDGTPAMIQQCFSSVNVVHGDGSLWWTGAICQGMKFALDILNPDYFVWLNDDIKLADNFICNLTELCQSGQIEFSIIGGIVYAKLYPSWLVFGGMHRKQFIRSIDEFGNADAIEVDMLNGNITVIPKAVVAKVGLPNADRFKHYGGDFEFVYRAKQAGFEVYLSRLLQAESDYDLLDLIRYMPPWMQWHFAKTLKEKQAIIDGFRSLKSHYNIWHCVNIDLINQDVIPWWKFELFYIRQVLKLMVRSIWSKRRVDRAFTGYFTEHKVPLEFAQLIRDKL